MLKLIGVLVVIAVLVGGVGYYLDWFSFKSTTDGNGETDVRVTIHKDKIQEDTGKARGKVRNLRNKIEDKIHEEETAN